MLKTKLIVVFGVLIGAAALSAVGVFGWHEYKHGSLFGTSLRAAADAEQSDEQSSASGSGGALAVNSNADSSDLGQLGSSQNGVQSPVSTTGNSNASPSTTANSSESAAEQMLNPSTFSQYNASKYLNSPTAFYADLQVGTGTTLAAGDQAEVVYKGWLTNGQLFDESKTNSSGQLQPLDFTYGASPSQVIAGWEQGLAGMKVGGIRFLIVPPAAGYGASGNGTIPGNSVLIFEVQLVSVQ